MNVRCHLTGVEIPLEDSYLLDTGCAMAVLRKARDRVAVLEKLVDHLAGWIEHEIPGNGQGKTKDVRYRKVVTRAVAEAMSSVEPSERLFVSWTDYRKRGALFRLTRLCEHPVYGERLRGLGRGALQRIAAKGRVLRSLLGVPGHDTELRLAVEVGVQLALANFDPKDQLDRLMSAVERGELRTCGIPAELESRIAGLVRRAVARRAQDTAHPSLTVRDCSDLDDCGGE